MTTTEHKPKRENFVTLRVSEEEMQWLREAAKQEDRTIASVLRLALRQYVTGRTDSP